MKQDFRPTPGRRDPIDVPALEGLAPALRRSLALAGAKLHGLAAVEGAAVLAADDALFERLADPLSAYVEAVAAPFETVPRAESEARALAWLATVEEPAATPRRFEEILLRLNVLASPRRNGWRRGEMGLSPDRRGQSCLFPKAEHRPAQMEKLRSLLLDPSLPAVFAAAAALALLTNAHPFRDGNGRTGRILFNFMLGRGGMREGAYIPLYEIARRSRGGYELALRRGEIFGDWAAYFHYMLEALECCRRLANGR